MTVLGQQVSLTAARTFGGRLVSTCGTDTDRRLRRFPRPEEIAGLAEEPLRAALGITNARARSVLMLARAFADGLEVHADGDHAETRRNLRAIVGVGPWTVEYLAVRVLRDRDAFTPSDLVLRRALGGVSPTQAAHLAEAWRPHRATALFRLWTRP